VRRHACENQRNLPAPNAGTRVDEFLAHMEKTFLENYNNNFPKILR